MEQKSRRQILLTMVLTCVPGLAVGLVKPTYSAAFSGLSHAEAVDKYLEEVGYWQSLKVPIIRESLNMPESQRETFVHETLEVLKKEYINHFVSKLSMQDIENLLSMNASESMKKFNRSCLDLHVDSFKNLVTAYGIAKVKINSQA